MAKRVVDICPEPVRPISPESIPHAPAICLSSVYQCDDPQHARALLLDEQSGYVYARNGHPNGDMLADKCRQLHGAERAAMVATGMGALATLVLAELAAGDHLVISNQLYGVTLDLLASETSRWGIETTVVDTTDLAATEAVLRAETKMLVVETITNPLLRVSDIRQLADLAHAVDASLLVDNSFASPAVCRPLEWGADWVVESLTKIMNGHSDVTLGCVCGSTNRWERIEYVLSRWGLSASPMDCWLALRGLATLALRAPQAGDNARQVAAYLESRPEVAQVHFPGLASHSDHALAQRQFSGQFGSMVTFDLSGGLAAAERFIRAVRSQIPFCPSLGEVSTTLSHPVSTSHRGLSDEALAALGISSGTIRLSVGIESPETILAWLASGLVKVH